GDTNKYPKESILEYLDELIEIANKSRISGFKLKPMLRKYLGEDIGVHPYTRKKAEFNSVKYLNKKQREVLEVRIENGKVFNSKGELFDSAGSANHYNNGKAIFVMDEHGKIYASTDYWVGEFHHSSFLGGEPVAMAGELNVISGFLVGFSNSTGHYQAKQRHINQFLEYLKTKGVNIDVLEKDII
ncbi:hypothetical protein, partial [Tenacibaculum sp.]|uniref:hypothetical protein n=1 Tax=Tenacibaculum sp. TaxID=1906242 RepID=UPI003AA8B8A1